MKSNQCMNKIKISLQGKLENKILQLKNRTEMKSIREIQQKK